MKSKFPIINDLDRLLTAINVEAALELAQYKRKVSTATREVQGLRRQRDAALGKAAEYKGYAQRYQRELIAARNEIKQLRKEPSNARV